MILTFSLACCNKGAKNGLASKVECGLLDSDIRGDFKAYLERNGNWDGLGEVEEHYNASIERVIFKKILL